MDDLSLTPPSVEPEVQPLEMPPVQIGVDIVQEPPVPEVDVAAPNTADIKEHNAPEGQLKGMPCEWEITLLEGDQIQAMSNGVVFVGTREEFSARLKG